MLPVGASSRDAQSTMGFYEEALRNTINWYQFAQKCNRQVSNGALVLVTGRHMTSSWAVASIKNDSAHESDYTLQLSSQGTGCHWGPNVSVTCRSGPIYDGQQDSKQEQTIFI